MSYVLYFGRTRIGETTDVEDDKMTAGGTLILELDQASATTAEAERLIEFIRLNQDCLRLTEQLETVPDLAAELDAKNHQLADFSDLAESHKWHVRDDAQQRRRILCPIFRRNGQITWRWDDDQTLTSEY